MGRLTCSDEDLQRALRLSEMEARKDEERRRQRMLQEQQQREQRHLEEDLFGLSSAFNNQNQYGYNQPQQQQQQVDPFGSLQQEGFGDDFNGQWANPFGNAFDGGNSARPLPHQLAGDNATTQIAHIARNAQKLDPFATLPA